MASFWREVILTSSPDKPITAHDPLTGTMLAHFSSSRSPCKGLALASNTHIAASHISAAAADGVKLRTVQFLCAIWCVAVDPTSSEFYAGGSAGSIYVVPRVGGRKLRDAGAEVTAWESEPNGAVMAVAMAHGHQNLISASEDGIIRIWDVESRSVVRIIGLAGGALSDLIVVKGINAINGARKGIEVVSNGMGGFVRGRWVEMLTS
ncbi:protein ROOT INITIATION DEFECTIVE 3-like [Phoenix dactylifera]|uniref:Protein ROOT INITIATION DEFECTIVE 3-like n=1 Tax=Phoenix dactylifera TaxID=42345 RepID=A0A8B7CXV9_PHODC|nr:protein ROOT INITIATION DEFECTIVE 3-like [Phoenix dactylifera]XP_038983837.1 protein ROOT INITIATION DEFECTIVE 3-like [Phoenix dactylifera]